MEIYNIPEQKRATTFKALEFEYLINGSPRNLSDVSIRICFRRRHDKGTIEKDISIGSGVTVTDAALGRFKIDTFQIEFEADIYFYDVKIEEGDDWEIPFGGEWPIIQNVTD